MSIAALPGIRVGHWSDPAARTGCTVVLPPPGTVASGEVRGGAPGTREWALLDPARSVAHVDAVVLTGGSAFGLAACDGAVRWCEEHHLGYPTPAGAVPIVVGLVLYDLAVGDPAVRPGPHEGYQACLAASAGAASRGLIGAGTGATVAKAWGPERVRPGGLGSGLASHGELVVAALVAVNALGDLRRAPGEPPLPPLAGSGGDPGLLQATTIGVLATNARLDKLGCLAAAQAGHDGFARALDPAHTGADGDALVALSVGGLAAALDTVRVLAAHAVEAAVRDALVPAAAATPE